MHLENIFYFGTHLLPQVPNSSRPRKQNSTYSIKRVNAAIIPGTRQELQRQRNKQHPITDTTHPKHPTAEITAC